MTQCGVTGEPQFVLEADDVMTGELVHGPFYIDAHIHVYQCFDESIMLDAASDHVAGYDRGEGTAVLALTELRAYHRFRAWRDRGQVGRWTLTQAGEPAVLFATRDDGRAMVILAGRQIVTQGRLGVLAIGADAEFADDQPVQNSIDATREAGAMAVLSYGIGKWRGARGRIIDAFIESAVPGELALGEIAARPFAHRPPRQFVRAAERGLTILPGSDPLIIRSNQTVPMSRAVRVDGSFDRQRFGRDLVEVLRHLGPDAPQLGSHLSLPKAVHHQIALRVARRWLALKGLPT